MKRNNPKDYRRVIEDAQEPISVKDVVAELERLGVKTTTKTVGLWCCNQAKEGKLKRHAERAKTGYRVFVKYSIPPDRDMLIRQLRLGQPLP